MAEFDKHIPTTSSKYNSFSWNIDETPDISSMKQKTIDPHHVEWQEFNLSHSTARGRGAKAERSSGLSLFDSFPRENHSQEKPAPNPAPEAEQTLESTPEPTRSAEMQAIYERANSYEKYRGLLGRVVGKMARSKGFRKVVRAAAIFSFMFALASCETADADSTPSASIVDSIDSIDYNDPDIGSEEVDLGAISQQADQDNINGPRKSAGSDQPVDLNNLPPEQETEEKQGIYEGYGEKGMWFSESKGGAYDFASATEIAEVCNEDECEMIKYAAANQIECLADYIAGLPEDLQPEGFKGLTILETEHKLESLSVDEYENIKTQFNKAMDGAFTRDIVLDGYYHNAYMRLKDPSLPPSHDNMELVECITNEDGTNALELYFTDDGTANGTIVGKMIIKISRIGGNVTGGCMQLVTAIEEGAHVYSDLVTVAENPAPDYYSEEEPDSTPEYDNNENEDGEEDENYSEDDSEDEDEPSDSAPEDYVESKDAYNLTIIDDNIENDISSNTGGGTIQNHTDLDGGSPTEQPSPEDYSGTEADIVENDAVSEAEPIQDYISEENNYQEDRGGTHADEYAPVQADQDSNEAALASEIPLSNAPGEGDDIEDILGEIGV